MNIMCRTCMQRNENLINMFEYCETSKLLPDMILECTTINIQRDDGFPLHICTSCLKKLTSAWDFREMVIKTDLKLRNVYNNHLMENTVQSSELFPHTVTIKSEICENVEKTENSQCNFDESVNDSIWNNNMIPETCVKEETTFTREGEKEFGQNENINIYDNMLEVQMMVPEQKEGILNDTGIDSDTKGIEDKCTKETLPETNNDSDYDDDFFNEVDNSNKSMMDLELYSEEKYGKLSCIEKEKMFIYCKICKRSFKYKYYFGIHVRLHTGDKHQKCNICGKTFVRQFQLRLHMSVHTNLRPFSCEICGKTFKTKNCVYKHKSVHSDDSLHTCTICQKSFKAKDLLRAHFQRHNKEKKYTCEICGKSFGVPSGLNSHMYTHSDEKNLPCPTCGKIYANNLSLRRHLRLHTGARPYPCSYCDRSFKRKAARDEHTSIHTGTKPFSCEICGKTFRHSSSLHNHMRIHKREAPYACEICPSQFKNARHLQNHMKVHE